MSRISRFRDVAELAWAWATEDADEERNTAWHGISMTSCPYYQQTGTKTCNGSCYDEPECVTGAPLEGWDTKPPAPWLAIALRCFPGRLREASKATNGSA